MARAMHGEGRPVPPSTVAAPDVGGELRVCVNIPDPTSKARGMRHPVRESSSP